MLSYPLPENISRQEFRNLVAQLGHTPTAKGLDPSLNIAVKDFDEIVDGKPRPHLSLFISQTAAQILEHKPGRGEAL